MSHDILLRSNKDCTYQVVLINSVGVVEELVQVDDDLTADETNDLLHAGVTIEIEEFIQ